MCRSFLTWRGLNSSFLPLFPLPLETCWVRSCCGLDQRGFAAFSLRILMASCLTFRSFIHFEFVFVYGVRKWSRLILLHVTVQFPQHHLLKRLSSFQRIFFPALSKISWPYVCGPIFGFSVLFHWSECLFLCQYHTVLMIIASSYSSKPGIVMPPALVFFFNVTLGIWGLFWFHTNFRIVSSRSAKNAGVILIGTLLSI